MTITCIIYNKHLNDLINNVQYANIYCNAYISIVAKRSQEHFLSTSPIAIWFHLSQPSTSRYGRLRWWLNKHNQMSTLITISGAVVLELVVVWRVSETVLSDPIVCYIMLIDHCHNATKSTLINQMYQHAQYINPCRQQP